MTPKRNHERIRKAALAGLIVLAVIAFRYFELDRYLSLDYIQASRERLQAYYLGHQFSVIAAYFGLYVLVTALSLPGAVVLSLVGGALFGGIVGTVVVSFASSIGATLACLISRFLLRQWVQDRFGARLAAINAGIEKEGGFYLFSLRLVPIFPYFVINLAMGLTPMRLWTFYWVSQTGMLAGTVLYVNAGRELAGIDSLSGIFSPGVLISFAVLGLFPVTVKKLLALYRRKSAENRPV